VSETVKLRTSVRVAAVFLGMFGALGAVLAFGRHERREGLYAIAMAILAVHAAVTGQSRRVSWQRSSKPSGGLKIDG
jgi:hypothetical protein